MRNIRLLSIIIIYMTIISAQVFAQNLGIGPDTFDPEVSAGVEMRFTNKGLLIPRVALTSTSSASPITSPAISLLIYNTATVGDVTPGYYYWTGSKWMRLLAIDDKPAWLLVGNAGTTPGTNFIGTTDAKDLVFKTNSTEKMRITSGGNVGIGTTAPGSYKLKINGKTYIEGSDRDITSSERLRYTWKGLELHADDGNMGESAAIDFTNNDGYLGRIVGYGAGTGNGGHLLFFTSPNHTYENLTERMVITNSGNVGIGTTSPSAQLHTTGTVRFAGVGSTSSNTQILTRDANGNLAYRAAGAWAGGSDNVNGSGVATRVAFWSGTNTLSSNANLYWDNTNSRLGVGTSAPITKFEIYGGHSDTKARLYSTGNGATLDASLDMWASEPGWTYDGSGIGNNVNGSPRYGRRNGNLGQSYIRFYNGDVYIATGSGDATNRVFIQNNGNVGIGTTSPAQKLDVSGGNIRTTGQLISTIATGTAPLSVVSTTLVTNLNADMLDGHHWSEVPTIPTNNVTGSGTATRVAFWSGTNTLSSNANLYWDNTNSRLGIGTASPATQLHVTGLSTFNSINRFEANGNGFYFGEQSTSYRNPSTNIPGLVVRMDEPNAGLDETKAALVLYNANGGLNTGAGLTFASREAVGAGNDVALSGIFGQKLSTGNVGGWSAGGLRFWVKNYGNIVEAMTIDNLGNVGIGTTSPTAQLHTTGTVRFEGVGSTSSNTQILTRDANGNLAYREAGAWAGGSNNVTGSGTATRVAFWSGTNTLSSNANLYWDNTNSRLGVGTSSPAEKLHINGSIRGDQSGALRINTGSGYIDIGPKNTSWAHFYTDRSRYWFSTGLTVETGNIGSYDEDLSLQTSGTTRITILNSNGNVGIGTTSPAAKLHVAGNIKTNTINETSDARFKKNIQNIDTPLSKVLSLRGVYYYWDLDNPDVQEIDSSKQIGMIAQEVEKILPELVNTDSNGYKSVEYSRVVAVLVEAMKEQQKVIEQQSSILKDQENTIKEQKDMINNLNERITKLEELIKVK